jgi:hypothetical protein
MQREHQSPPSRHGCAGFRNLSRRQALRVGSLGALGLSMGDLFQLQAADKQALSIGGEDMFDLKTGESVQ